MRTDPLCKRFEVYFLTFLRNINKCHPQATLIYKTWKKLQFVVILMLILPTVKLNLI